MVCSSLFVHFATGLRHLRDHASFPPFFTVAAVPDTTVHLPGKGLAWVFDGQPD